MAFSESLFLFEIRVEDLNSIENRRYRIRCQFGDVFTVHLKDPNEGIPQRPLRRGAKKKVLNVPVPTVQTVMVSANINSLESHLQKYPLHLCVWAKGNAYSLGSTNIKWSPKFIDYLESLKRFENPEPVLVTSKYCIYNELISKKMAMITLTIKLTRMAAHVQCKIEPYRPSNMTPAFTVYNSDPETNVSEYGKPKPEEIGIIRTVYGGDKRVGKHLHSRKKDKIGIGKVGKKESEKVLTNQIKQTTLEVFAPINETKTEIKKSHNMTKRSNLGHLVRSNTEINIKSNTLIKSRSCSSMQPKKHFDAFDYIFSACNGPFGNNVYCVGYCTIENTKSPQGSQSIKSSANSSSQKIECVSGPGSSKCSELTVKKMKHAPNECEVEDGPKREEYSFKICDSGCERLVEAEKRFENVCTIDFPKAAGHMIQMTKCAETLKCLKTFEPGTPESDDNKILLDVQNFREKCCKIEKTEIVGDMKMQMKTDKDDPLCYCTCDCTFGVRMTTFCTVCGGYEDPGDPGAAPPDAFPCPIYHKIEREQKLPVKKGKKRSKGSSIDSEQNKTDDRFKFNYGYKGIPPQIGHSECCAPCGGSTGPVPNHMGWLWTAGNVPGLKFRPSWRPGAINKHVARMLKHAKYPEEVLQKKKKKRHVEKKNRPLLAVEKKDGEYTITMETMKVMNKPRPPNIFPFEDKPVLTFKVGRTDEENAMRARVRARRQRNLDLEKRRFIENTFQDLCQQICTKTYEHALELLPGQEEPPCPCMPALPGADRVDLERACSCSDQTRSSDASATDEDEWILEFTPPNALYDPTYKKRTTTQDVKVQYNYLDFAVKLFDRWGNQVPRFFIGPDGTKQCSDLGGFWGPDHNWLAINVDGYVANDGRWAPYSFVGPNGEAIESEDGLFETAKGQWLVVGVDGYVENGRWRKYAKPVPMPEKNYAKILKLKETKKGTHAQSAPIKKIGGIDKTKQTATVASETNWSCFGTADPKELGKMGVFGHGHDRKMLLSTLETMIKQGDTSVQMPHKPIIPRGVKIPKKKGEPVDVYDPETYFSERAKCHHPPPSDKGIQAVDGYGRKTYFTLKNQKNTRPRDRIKVLEEKGISFHSGWKPGCISKRLLRKLNRAKRQTSTVQMKKLMKKSKKRVEDKPTLIVAKRNGEYFIEMQVSQTGPDANVETYDPLKYKIASADNQDKIERRQRKEERLIRKQVKEVFKDSLNPDVCHQRCLKAYKQAIGLLPYDPNNPECICPEDFADEEESVEYTSTEEDDSSDDSSLDLDFEIHFSPPIALNSKNRDS